MENPARGPRLQFNWTSAISPAQWRSYRGADLHLPLGTGTIDLRHNIQLLQGAGYDGTITLEVFTPDRHHLLYSRDVLRREWDECAAKRR